MSIIIKYNQTEYKTDTILWDRDSYFIDFNIYWARLVGSIAQKIAENTTDNWNKFNLIRTQVIKVLGINLESCIPNESGPVTILPVNIFSSLLASSLQTLLIDKKLDELNNLFQSLIFKALHENQAQIKDSILYKNTELLKKINNADQILVTNDSLENNKIFLNESGILVNFTKIIPQANKEQLSDFLKLNSIFITQNSYLYNSYLKKEVKNVLLVNDINAMTFTEVSYEQIKINIDGASKGNPGPASIGIAIYRGKELVEEISEFIGNKTNNFAEYTALIRALEISLERGFHSFTIQSDSELVVNQMNKKYKVKDADIKDLFDKSNSLIEKFKSVKIVHIPREENLRADKLANNAFKNNSTINSQ